MLRACERDLPWWEIPTRGILALCPGRNSKHGTVDLARYPRAVPAENELFTVGWIGTPVTAKYVRLVESALLELRKGGDLRVVLVGPSWVELRGLTVELRTWSEETEATEIGSFDVGIMPLPDEPWERGKCGYKLIQYMACSRPVVASPVGVNRRIVEEGVNGFLATTTEDWIRGLATLRRDPPTRQRMGEAGRRKVEMEYCTQVTAPRLAALLRSAAGRL